jgi:hypothetical protein
MKGKILGICLSILGISGLILALIYMNAAESFKHLSILLASGICGAIIFFTGIWLLPRKTVYDPQK